MAREGAAGVAARTASHGHMLDLDSIFSDDARGRLHCGQGSRTAGRAFHIKESDFAAVRRESRLMHIALQCGEGGRAEPPSSGAR